MSSRQHYTVVFAGFAAQIVLQFALQVLLAQIFGTQLPMDAYRSAIAAPIALSAVFAGAIGPILITILGRNEPGVDRPAFAGAVLTAAAVLSMALAVLGWTFSVPLMAAFLPQYPPEEVAAVAQLFRILVWLVPANTLIGLFQSVLNASLVFTPSAVGGVAGPLLTVAIVAVFGATHGIASVAWSTLAGALFNVAIQAPFVLQAVALRRGTGILAKFQNMLWLSAPIVVASLVLKIDPLVDVRTAPHGEIAQLNCGNQIVNIFIMLASGTLSTVAFPRIARRAAHGEAAALEFSFALRTLVTLCLPAFAALLIFAHPLVRDIFERGEFTPADTAVVARLVQIYSAMLLGAAIGELCSKTMYSLRDSLTPTLIGSTILIVGFVAKLALAPRLGIDALAAITSVVYVAVGAGLLGAVRVRAGPGIFAGLLPHVGRCLAACVGAVAGGLAVLHMPIPFSGMAGMVAGAAIYFGLLLWLDPETRTLGQPRNPDGADEHPAEN